MVRLRRILAAMRYALAFILPLLIDAALLSAEPPAFTVLSVLVDETALAGAHDVELQGNLAFVAGKGGSLAVIDVADPARPRISGRSGTRSGSRMPKPSCPPASTCSSARATFMCWTLRPAATAHGAHARRSPADRSHQRPGAAAKCAAGREQAGLAGRVRCLAARSPAPAPARDVRSARRHPQPARYRPAGRSGGARRSGRLRPHRGALGSSPCIAFSIQPPGACCLRSNGRSSAACPANRWLAPIACASPAHGRTCAAASRPRLRTAKRSRRMCRSSTSLSPIGRHWRPRSLPRCAGSQRAGAGQPHGLCGRRPNDPRP